MSSTVRPTQDEEHQTLFSEQDARPSFKSVRGETTRRVLTVQNLAIFAVCVIALVLVGSGISSLMYHEKRPSSSSSTDFTSKREVPLTPVGDDDYDQGSHVKATPKPTKKKDAGKLKVTSSPTKPSKTTTPKPTKGGNKLDEADQKLKEEMEKEDRANALKEEDEEETVKMFEEEEEVMDKDSGVDTDDDDNDDEEDDDESSSNTSSDTEQLKMLIQDEMSDGGSDDDDDDNSDSNADYVPAPRTTDAEYNEIDPDREYLMHNPSGGMTNQELELVNSMHMAQVLNRTLYVPMIGRHSNMPAGYNNLRMSELFVADRLFDFEWFNRYVRVIPLNMTLRRFMAKFAKEEGANNIRYVPTAVGFDGDGWARQLKRAPQKLIFFGGRGMWGRWWGPTVRNVARQHISFAPYLRQLAMQIADKALGPRFYAIHGRLGDELYLWDGKDSGAAFVRTAMFSKWDKSLKLYLASDDPNHHFFKELKSKIEVVTANNLKGPEVDRFRNLFPNSRVMKDMFGVLDKLICTMGIGFMGSPFSTFSSEIRVMRGTARYVFPELYARRHNISATDTLAIRLKSGGK